MWSGEIAGLLLLVIVLLVWCRHRATKRILRNLYGE